MAMRTGISGEEPSSPCCEAGDPVWLPGCGWVVVAPPEPVPGLPCPVPPSPLVVDAPPFVEDEPPAEDPVPEEFEAAEPVEPLGAVGPPPAAEDFARGSRCVGGLFPVAVGGASEYWTPLESVA
jgi:hypothetical protein